MSPLFVIFGITAIVVPVLLCIIYKNRIEHLTTDNKTLKDRNELLEMRFKMEQAEEEANALIENGWDLINSFAEQFQFQLTELQRTSDRVTFMFKYQDGLFTGNAGIQGQDFEIMLDHLCYAGWPYTSENFEKVRTVCHNMSKECRFAKYIYTFDEKQSQFDIHLIVEMLHPTSEQFQDQLRKCFVREHAVHDYLWNSTTTEEQRLDFRRSERMLIDAEMQHEAAVLHEKKPHAKDPNHGTLSEYLSYIFNGEDVEDMLALRVQTPKNTEYIRQRDQIASFDILSAVVKGSGEQAEFISHEPIVLTLDATANHYVFTLHPLKSRKDYLTVRMTAVCTPHEFLQSYVPNATYEPQAISMLLCYVKTELPDIEDDEDDYPTTSRTKQVRHGRQLMQQKFYAQAIAVLTPINRQLKAKFFNLTRRDQELFFSTCYYLGFCYTDLHQYEKAYYYLSTAHDCNRFDYTQEYINCLAECHDPRVFNAIEAELNDTTHQLDEMDKDEDRGTEEQLSYRRRLIDYYAFLQRRRGYSQINFGYLDEATDTFKHLLDHEDSREYAENELKYIETLKNQKKP